MLEGVVDDSGLPTLELEIGGRLWKAVVDTGFNGDLELPYAIGPYVEAEFIGTGLFALGGGQQSVEETYRVQIPFDGALVGGEATFVNGDTILLGTGLLHQHHLQVNFVTCSVSLERVTHA
jgi:predicted aspartyl protease